MPNRTDIPKSFLLLPFYLIGRPFTITLLSVLHLFLYLLAQINRVLNLPINQLASLIRFCHFLPAKFSFYHQKRGRGRPRKRLSLLAKLISLPQRLPIIAPIILWLDRHLGVSASSIRLSRYCRRLLKKKHHQRQLYRFKTKAKPPTPTIIFYRSHIFGVIPSQIFNHRVGLALIAITLGIISGSGLFYLEILKDLPHPTDLATHQPILTTKIYDRHGNLLYKIFKNENRSLVTLQDIPIYLQQATIAIEDQNFYQHSGFSLRGIVRAFKTNLEQDSLQGGSTITQQLIKNTLLTSEKTFTRKIKELVLSVLTEFYFSKDEILAMYFNQVPYGGAAYGIEEASQMFFGKSASHLSLSEAAFIAGLPAAPTRFSPYGIHPELAVMRQHQVLRRMVEDGYISLQQAEEAKSQKIVILPQKNSIQAPHFVMYIKDQLVNKYGLQMVEQGGLEVTTSLDLTVQETAQSLLNSEVNQLTKLNVTNGAALVTVPKTGEVLAMVGSTNYFDTQHDGQVNITIRPRQPGSSIKPINYAVALGNGFTPATIIPDTPICYSLPGQRPYCPKNYDNTYHGPVTLRQALANSFNIPAVKTLSQIGVSAMVAKGREMGITTWDDSSRFGLSLTLGGGEVKMVDMAVAYGTFANMGYRVNLNPILEVKNYQGKILEQINCKSLKNAKLSPVEPVSADTKLTTCNGERVLDPRVAYQITDILSDNTARSRAFGTNSVLNIPNQQVAVKTGTTNSLRDNWTFGYTSDYLVATWVGNNDNSPMSYIASGITGASPIWQKIILSLLDQNQPHAFVPPTNLTKVKVCTLTGTLACNGCPSQEEYFLAGTEPKSHCSEEAITQIKNKVETDNHDRDRLLQGISTRN